MDDTIEEVRQMIQMRLETARMQQKRMPFAAQSRVHAGGVVDGLEEALNMLPKPRPR